MCFLRFCQYILFYIPTNLAFLSHNVLAVYDDFATQISETEGFAGLQNCGGDKTA
jgi:hypothetical protein